MKLTQANLDEYLTLVSERWLGDGIAQQLAAFQEGFNQATPMDSMRLFTGAEAVQICAGLGVAWDMAELDAHIVASDGVDERSFGWLKEILCEMTPEHNPR